jgi:SPP1 family predicted phage head-tail adaptor
VNAGVRDRRILLQTRTLTTAASGEEVESWNDVQPLWARKRDMRAGERWTANQLVAEIETVWGINYFPGWDIIRPDTHRLIYRNRVYEIHGLREIGRHDGIEIASSARGEAVFG